jgi:hypothetical protein
LPDEYDVLAEGLVSEKSRGQQDLNRPGPTLLAHPHHILTQVDGE